MNLQSHQAGAMAGVNAHNLRTQERTPASVDKSLSAANVWLDRTCIKRDESGIDRARLGIPERQPDTGRKIRPDARVAASFVMTLPEEIDRKDQSKVDAWADASMSWWDTLPGKPAYAVMHLDEPGARPHIHAVRIPVDEKGNWNYKRDFGGHRSVLDDLHVDYALRLEHLDVKMSAPEDRAMRRAARKDPEDTPARRRPTRRQPETRQPERPRADLEAENEALREQLIKSKMASQKDYQGLKQIKDSKLPLDEKLIKMAELVDRVLTPDPPATASTPPAPVPGPQVKPELSEREARREEILTGGMARRPRKKPEPPQIASSDPAPVLAPAPPLFAEALRAWQYQEQQAREAFAAKLVKEKNRELRQRLIDSKKGSPAIFRQLKELKTTDLPIPEKILAMTRFVDDLVLEDPLALPPTAAVEKPDRQEKSESESTPESGTVDFDDIDLPEISEIRARNALAREQPPAPSPAPTPAPAPATPSLTEEVDIWLKQQAWERKQRKAIEAERNEERLARKAVEVERDKEKKIVKRVISERTDIHNQSLEIGQKYAALETKHKTLDTAHQQLKSDYEYLRHLFQPLIKIWNNLQEHRGTEGSWLKAVCKVAANVAEKFMAETPGVTPRQYRDQTPEQTPKPQQRGVRIPEH